jgi:hypothetical protein
VAVVHVDGSARPQVIERDTNPLYYDILQAFERESRLPVLVNTSFNVHEEPIVNKPSESIRALLDGRIDFVVTPQGIYERVDSGLERVENDQSDSSSAGLDSAQMGKLTGQIEQNFVAARPADEGETGRTTCYRSRRNVDLWQAGETGGTGQPHCAHPEQFERLACGRQ